MTKDNLLFSKWLLIKNQLNKFGDKINEDKLIRFDFKVILLIVTVLILFLLSVSFKIHGSSIPYWNNIVSDGNDEEKGLLLGTPRSIRSDEWLVQTPFILSQLNQENKYSLENESLGEGRVPLLMNLPTKHISSIFRPQNWGYFIFDAERGFSFQWSYKIFALFISFFFLLMIVTRNNFWISFFASFWLFYSSFIQWWFSTGMPETITAFSLIFVASSYIFVSKKKPSIIVASLLLFMFAVNFALAFYPPFQISLAYLLIFMIGGFFAKNFSRQEFKRNLKVRIAGTLMPVIVFISVLSIFYIDTKETLSMVINTVYPGKRVSTGGKLSLTQLFSGFYGIFMKQDKFPIFLGNICEASNYVLLFPLAISATALNFISKKKNDLILLVVLLYLILMSLWWLVGFPESISKVTLLSFSPPNRALIGMGVASIISVAIVLSKKREIIKNKRALYLFIFIIFLLVLAHGFSLREVAPDFVRYRYVLTVSIFVTMLSYFFLRGKGIAFSLLVTVLVFASTFSVNPTSSGLSPIYNKNLTKEVKKEEEKNVNNLWIVYGKHTMANFLKASGVKVFNGVQYTPKLEKFSLLDTDDKNQYVYNRYAHIAVSESELIGDEVQFNLISPDTLEIRVDPCSEKLTQIGINRFIFSYVPNEQKNTCLEPLSKNPVSGAWLYKRK